MSKDTLTGHINHVFESSKERELFLRKAAKIEALEARVEDVEPKFSVSYHEPVSQPPLLPWADDVQSEDAT